MTIYRQRPVVIEAILFDGTLDGVNKVLKFVGRQTTLPLTLSNQDGSKSILLTSLGLQSIVYADMMVVRDIDGFCHPMKRDVFEQTYELEERSPVSEMRA